MLCTSYVENCFRTRPGRQSTDDATHIRYGTNENIEDDEEDYEDEDDDDIYDWDGCTGNFTKKYNAATSNSSRVPYVIFIFLSPIMGPRGHLHL